MHIGKRTPLQLYENEQYDKLFFQLMSGKLIHNQNKILFPVLNSCNKFALIDSEAHINF